MGLRSSASSLLAVLLLAGCGGPRVEVVDALSGLPLPASVRVLPDGLLIVEAPGHEMRLVRPGERVALAPLWEARFMDPGERPPPRPARDHRPCCPGMQAR